MGVRRKAVERYRPTDSTSRGADYVLGLVGRMIRMDMQAQLWVILILVIIDTILLVLGRVR